MTRWWTVAQHEFLTNVRRRSFLVAAIGTPIFFGIIFAVIIVLSLNDATSTGGIDRVGWVDESGLPAVTLPDDWRAYADAASAAADYAEGAIDAYVVVPADYRTRGRIDLYATESPTDSVRDSINALLRESIAIESAPDVADRLIDTGSAVVELRSVGRVVTIDTVLFLILLPMGVGFLLILAMQITGTYVLSGVTGEKSDRVVELLITSVRPFDLLLGKLIGLGALGLLQIAIWLLMGGIALVVLTPRETLAGFLLPVDLVLLALAYFILGYLLVSALMAIVGIVIGTEQEARQFAGWVTIGIVVPYFFIISYFEAPDGVLAVVFSILPVTSPTGMLLRAGLTSVPAWQIALSLGLLTLTVILVTWATARIFRWAALQYGNPPSLRRVIAVAFGREGGR